MASCRHTFSCVMPRANCRTFQVPIVFISMASFSFASNLSVAAQWNTTDTSSWSLALLSRVKPSSSNKTSPWMNITFCSASGFSVRKRSNNWNKITPIHTRIVRMTVYAVSIHIWMIPNKGEWQPLARVSAFLCLSHTLGGFSWLK